MKKLLLSSAVLTTFALFTACGDDSSSGPEEESSSSIEVEDESSSSVEEEGKSSAADKKSSSSEAKKRDSSSSEEATSSSSEAESSSSIAEESSSSNVIASSSSAKQSSSSEAVAEVMPSGTYDCDSYNCVDTTYLKAGITYGEILDTRDDQVYKVVTIGDQTWMAQNLNYDPGDVSDMGSYAWSGCYGEGGYDYVSEGYLSDSQVATNCSKYGRLYTWEVAMDNANCAYDNTCSPSGTIRGVCPEGWHLPSHGEFETLINYIDPSFGYGHTDDASSSTAGYYLKATSGWNSSGNGDDTYGFSALPGGIYYSSYSYEDFDNVGGIAYFWSSTEYYSSYAYYLALDYDNDGADLLWYRKDYAKSVRCLKD